MTVANRFVMSPMGNNFANTDGMGFVRNLKENGVDVKGKKITILGAGGAATAIQVQCALDGAKKSSIFNRKDEFYANGEKTVRKI